MELEFSGQILKNITNFTENPSSGSILFPCGRTDMTKLMVAFRSFAKPFIKIWWLRIAYWIPKSTNTRSKYFNTYMGGCLTVHLPHEIKWSANLLQLGNFIDVFLARRVSGTYGHHQEH